jgi:hypothetical protein
MNIICQKEEKIETKKKANLFRKQQLFFFYIQYHEQRDTEKKKCTTNKISDKYKQTKARNYFVGTSFGLMRVDAG